MTSKTETKPTTTTTTKSVTIMSITKISTTVAITMAITTLITEFRQGNYTYNTICQLVLQFYVKNHVTFSIFISNGPGFALFKYIESDQANNVKNVMEGFSDVHIK
jgi:type IV secretory pathway component VirB8